MKEASDPVTPKTLFTESLARCSLDEGFVPAFYKRFMASSPEVSKRFRYTEFEKQNRMLLNSLELAAHAIDGEPEALSELKKRSQTHDRDHMNIKPELYDLWLDSLVLTAGEFDDDWNEGVEEGWRTVLGFVIHRMVSSY